jgi:D-psicose/D-tagatose/L-ribulose 3-epimerase
VKFGANTLIWTGAFNQSHLALLPRLKEGGFDGIEIAVFHVKDFPIGATRKALEQNRMQATFCTALGPGMSAISEDAAARRRALTYLEDCTKIAADIGARVFAGPFYAPVGYLSGRRRTADEWSREVEFLQSLGGTLDRNDVTLAVEPLNRFETFFLNTAADAAKLCGEVNHPRIGILFDTFHANIEERDVAAAIRTAGPYLKHVHTCENDRGTPGTGHVPWPGVFEALRGIGYDGWGVIESFGYTIKEIATAACIWRDLAPSPESIAFDGVKFLRQQAAKSAAA